MKTLFTALLCLLLLGCAPSTEVPEAPVPPTEASVSREAAASLEEHYGSAVEVHPLPLRSVQQVCAVPGGIVLSSGRELFRLNGQLQATVSCQLDYDASVQVSGDQISAFDPDTRQFLLLDDSLQEVRRLTLPQDLSGNPVLGDGILYYCTSNAIYGWDLESGIRRRIKETSCEDQTLVGLHLSGTVLQCRVRDGQRTRDLFLDAEHGRLLKEMAAQVTLTTVGSTYYAVFPSGLFQNLVFGNEEAPPRGLFPEEMTGEGTFLPNRQAAVTVCTEPDGSFRLDLYRLDSGVLQDSLILKEAPKAILENGDAILLLVHESSYGCDVLLQWHPSDASSGSKDHTDTYYTAEDPDHAGLALCRDYAKSLSETFGIEILIWKDAAAVEPWDYTFEAEHQYPVILGQLHTLEQCLSRYPRSLLADTAGDFNSLKLCLVRQITGTDDSESLNTATGIQFFNGNDVHVVLAAGPYLEQALYHELFHVMETRVLSASSALDRWNELNPAGFSYDLNYSTNAGRNSGVYLEKDSRAFVDTYSMSFPKEDRARVFEYAMLPQQEALFRSDILQKKLQALCTGIREAYGLEGTAEALPWEQYLD